MKYYLMKKKERSMIYMVLMGLKYHQEVQTADTILMMPMIYLRLSSAHTGLITHQTLHSFKHTCVQHSDVEEWVEWVEWAAWAQQPMEHHTSDMQNQHRNQIEHHTSQAAGQMGHLTTNQNQTLPHISMSIANMLTPAVADPQGQVHTAIPTPHPEQAVANLIMEPVTAQMHMQEIAQEPLLEHLAHNMIIKELQAQTNSCHHKDKLLRKCIKLPVNSKMEQRRLFLELLL